MTRWEHLARRVVLGVVTATTVLLLLGMVLSYSGLRSFFIGCGLPVWAASLSPLCVDLLAAVGYVALLVLHHKLYPGVVVALSVLGSAAGQGYHLSHGGIASDITDSRVIFAAGASAMICAGLAGHLLWRILERALPAGFIRAMQADLNESVFDSSEPAPDLNPERDRTATPLPTRAGRPVGARITELAEHLEQIAPAPKPAAPARTLTAVPAPRIHRPAAITATVRPSQQPGPCPDCQHHTGNVSKSARYRCANGTCTTCTKLDTAASPTAANV